MKLTPSILTARESSLTSLASPPRNRAPLVGASEKGSVTPNANLQTPIAIWRDNDHKMKGNAEE